MRAIEVSWLWLLPAIPALGAVLNATVGRASRQERLISAIAIAAVTGALGVALVGVGFLSRDVVLTQHLWNVIDTGGMRVDVALAVDPLSILLVLVVTGIGALIHVFSTAYLSGDAGYWRFFAGMNLFVSAMLVLVMASNLVLLLAGWEAVTLCGWLLIGFWHDDAAKVSAANQAFLVNRLGDVGLVLGIMLLFWTSREAPTFDLRALAERFDLRAAVEDGTPGRLTLACVLIFAGAAAKSAQLPLHGWLPSAMVGPTPVSALIHAATMVAAGIYLLVRLSFVYSQSPVAMTVVACTGAATAIFAATCALVQTDFKRVLAYSTISQLGFMFLAVGVGAWWAAIFHLVAHAFFKAALFLGAGAVLHRTHHEQDLLRLGGLQQPMPVVSRIYAFAALALAGLPLAGSFFSKDFILHGTFRAGSNLTVGWLGAALWAGASLAALGTSVYAWRSWTLVFGGTWRGPRQAPAEDAPRSMRWVLVLLAAGSAGTAALALPAFDGWLDPSLGFSTLAVARSQDHLGPIGSALLIGFAVAIAFSGLWLASWLWGKGPRVAAAPAFLLSGWGFEALYERLAGAVIAVSARLAAFDRLVVDGVVSALAAITHVVCTFAAAFDLYVIDGIVHLAGEISMRTGRSLRRLQTGDLMRYLCVAVAGALIVVCLQYWMR